jgi:hypothetical protein
LQVAALHACCNFINALDDARERETFQPMLVPMLAALGRCLTAGDESSAQVMPASMLSACYGFPFCIVALAGLSQDCCRTCSSLTSLCCARCLQDVLELLIEVAESYPKFLRKHLQELVSAMMQVRVECLGQLVSLASLVWL